MSSNLRYSVNHTDRACSQKFTAGWASLLLAPNMLTTLLVLNSYCPFKYHSLNLNNLYCSLRNISPDKFVVTFLGEVITPIPPIYGPDTDSPLAFCKQLF